jgi:hypothetical protein
MTERRGDLLSSDTPSTAASPSHCDLTQPNQIFAISRDVANMPHAKKGSHVREIGLRVSIFLPRLGYPIRWLRLSSERQAPRGGGAAVENINEPLVMNVTVARFLVPPIPVNALEQLG